MSSITGAAAVTAKAAASPSRRRRHPTKEGEGRFGFMMIGLAVLFVAVFTAIPIFASFLLSFSSWDVISPPEFVGLKNYKDLFSDGPVLKSFGVTIGMALAIVVLQLVVGLVLAVLVNQRKMTWLRTIFRTTFYLPLLASTAAVSIFMG
jgi:multiple sugar transport system permease protein